MQTPFLKRLVLKPNTLPHIVLHEGEYDYYHGACQGVVVQVEGDQIVSSTYLHTLPADADLVTWGNEILADNNHEYYLGWMSCYEFGEPVRLSAAEPASFARLARIHEKIQDD